MVDIVRTNYLMLTKLGCVGESHLVKRSSPSPRKLQVVLKLQKVEYALKKLKNHAITLADRRLHVAEVYHVVAAIWLLFIVGPTTLHYTWAFNTSIHEDNYLLTLDLPAIEISTNTSQTD
uniref:Uncharacterized protein n=1 Tax=Glossina austeni TaxID=7395 RepID=A0A1A9VLJ3_GLOAU